MGRRNKQSFIAQCERDIDEGWKRLAIFASNRPAALLKLVTATDDRVRLTTLARAAPEMQAMAVRFGQDALHYGIPWIYQFCSPSEQPVPRLLTEAECLDGVVLSEYARAYAGAVVAFTNYHRGRFHAVAESGRPCIRFEFADAQASLAETERV